MTFNPSDPSNPSRPSGPPKPNPSAAPTIRTGPTPNSGGPTPRPVPTPSGPGGPSTGPKPLAPGAPRPAPGGFGGPRPAGPGGFGGPRPGGFGGPRPGGAGGFGAPRPGGGGGGRFGRTNYQQPPSKDEHRINERIRVPQVRLIDEIGTQVGIIATADALKMAKERGLDLMEVSPNAQPPVCKITDYGKFKYEKKKKEHQAKKKQTVIKVKEIQLRPQTDEHDLDYKMKNMREFLIEGDKAKVTIMFRGREVAYSDQGYKMMARLKDELKDVAVCEYEPKMEGKKMIMILAPNPAAQKK